MATSSGNSSGSSQMVQNIGCDEDLQALMNERKRKRMESNRESARRSRKKKQKQLDDLMAQVSQLRKENNQIMTSVTITTQHYMNVEAENSVLRAQMMELSQRLQSLNEIINFMNTNNNNINGGRFENEEFQTGFDSLMMMNNDPWNLMYLNQPAIMASTDIFQY
ncbi:DNA-binding transcription factor [Lithospermum erythrorhizon]|uniref:DNA-binding transcription factor n=1 Tax=Lithospermum erythrorhizon TaxID=34254 RepID=A0AAV3PSY2_LITER